LEKNTLVIFTSDTGTWTPRIGWSTNRFCTRNRCGFVHHDVEEYTSAGKVDREHLVSNGLDLMPTVCDFAGVVPPADLPGRSLRRLAEGERIRIGGTMSSQRARTAGWCGREVQVQRLRARRAPRDADRPGSRSGEMTNLAERPEYRDELNRIAACWSGGRAMGDSLARDYIVRPHQKRSARRNRRQANERSDQHLSRRSFAHIVRTYSGCRRQIADLHEKESRMCRHDHGSCMMDRRVFLQAAGTAARACPGPADQCSCGGVHDCPAATKGLATSGRRFSIRDGTAQEGGYYSWPGSGSTRGAS